MGKDKLVDKTIRPLTTLTSVTPADVTVGMAVNTLGRLPIGNYKGALAFWDLNKAVNEPLVDAERQHILGILDGREGSYDRVSVTIPAGAAGSVSPAGTLTVPTGEVWYINTVQLFHASLGAGNQGGANWYCSLWTDRLGALGHGQAFHAAHQISGINSNQTVTDDFWTDAPFLGITHKDVMLRAPAGTVFTCLFDVAVGTLAADLANCTMSLFGFVGKLLVAP